MQADNPCASDLRPKAVFSVLVAGHRAARLQRNWYTGEQSPGQRQAQLEEHLQRVLGALRNSAARAFKQAEGILRADRIARLYARRRRDHSWAIFVAAALAVFCAVAGSLTLWPASLSGFWLFWGICEFFLLRYIIGHVLQLRYRDWHGHWMRYRFIAEQLRYLQIGYPLMVLPHAFQRPSWTVRSRDGEAHGELVAAELWLLQRLLIATGPPRPAAGADNSQHYNLTEHNTLALRYFHAALQEHRDYFARSYQRLHQDHELLHHLAMLLFGTTFVAVSVHFFCQYQLDSAVYRFSPRLGCRDSRHHHAKRTGAHVSHGR